MIVSRHPQVLIRHPNSHLILDTADRYDNTPLHIAAKKGYTDVVALLIEKSHKIDPVNDEELTPLHLAAKYGRVRYECIVMPSLGSATYLFIYLFIRKKSSRYTDIFSYN